MPDGNADRGGHDDDNGGDDNGGDDEDSSDELDYKADPLYDDQLDAQDEEWMRQHFRTTGGAPVSNRRGHTRPVLVCVCGFVRVVRVSYLLSLGCAHARLHSHCASRFLRRPLAVSSRR